MKLCDNCLEANDTTKDVPVGRSIGTQRDPVFHEVALCEPCRHALIEGDWSTIHERYSSERAIRKDVT